MNSHSSPLFCSDAVDDAFHASISLRRIASAPTRFVPRSDVNFFTPGRREAKRMMALIIESASNL